MKKYHCEVAPIAEKNIPSDSVAFDLSDFFKIFSDSTRIKVLFAIKDYELCVHDIAVMLGMQQPAVSHQLKVLRHCKIVKTRRDGKKTLYSLDDHHIFEILDVGLTHLSHK
ncbi:MAG: metalloregulator ArsR/SmtB family transcription factor [Bacillota bacterium]